MRTTAGVFVGATMAILSAVAVASAGPNLLANGDFELDPMNANNWTCADGHGVAHTNGLSWTTDFKHGGNYSAKLQNTGVYFNHSAIALKALTRYTVTYWVKTNLTAGGYCSRMDLNSANGFVWMTWGILNTGVSDWKQVIQSFTTSAASGLSFKFAISSWEGGNTGTEWADDVVLTEDSIQPIPRSNWKVTASEPRDPNNPAAAAIDGNPGSRYCCNSGDRWFRIDLGTSRTFNRIEIDARQEPTNFPNSYQLYISDDMLNWGSAISVTATSGLTTKSFPSQTKRYIKLVPVGGTCCDGWSIHEINLYAPDNTKAVPRSARAGTVTPGDAVSIYDLSGRLVKEFKDTEFGALTAQQLSGSGVYMVTVVTGGAMYTQRLLVAR